MVRVNADDQRARDTRLGPFSLYWKYVLRAKRATFAFERAIRRELISSLVITVLRSFFKHVRAESRMHYRGADKNDRVMSV